LLVDTEPAELNHRLDARFLQVHGDDYPPFFLTSFFVLFSVFGQMVDAGLVDELRQFSEWISEHAGPSLRSAQTSQLDFTRGILQAIGCKEFRSFLPAFGPTPGDGAACIETAQRNTRRYARQQRAWLRTRFAASAAGRGGYPLFRFDSSHVDRWEANVEQPAADVVAALLAGTAYTNLPAMYAVVDGAAAGAGDAAGPATFDNLRHVCELCGGRVIVGALQWGQHIDSRSHRRLLKRQRRTQLRDTSD
jgi:tRNA dimethylallyltransferase